MVSGVIVKFTDVFFRNLEAYRVGYRYIINQGGSRSSKTYSLCQLMHFIASKEKKRISVVGMSMPHLKRGAMRDFFDYIASINVYNEKNHNKSDKIYHYPKTGSYVEFFSVDQKEKVFGAGRDILFANEVNNIDADAFRHLVIRTLDRVFVDFNPTYPFYILDDYARREGAVLIKSTYKNNPYLPAALIAELEEAGKRDANFKKVFLDGELGEAIGVIFKNWEIGKFDETLPYVVGVDFGFVNDPTAMTKVAVDAKNKIIYLDELCYNTGLLAGDIAQIMKNKAPNALYVCDTDHRLKKEIESFGVNIIAAKKTAIVPTLLQMQGYNIVITSTSYNLEKELRNYVWKTTVPPIPVDLFNHLIDAARYGFVYLTDNHVTNKYIVQ